MFVLFLALLATEPVDLDAEVDAIESGEVDLLTYDYGRLRFHPDNQAAWDAMDRVERHVSTLYELPEEYRRTGKAFSSCLLGEQAHAALSGIRAAKLSPTRKAYDAARDYALERIGQARREIADAESEIAADDDPELVATLRRLHAADQAWRGAAFDWPEAAADYEREVMMATAYPRLCTADDASGAFMKDALTEIEWFTISEYGEEADRMAWLLVQHADDDPAFQRDIVDRLGRLWADGETDPAHYAFLHDRLADDEGRAQRYGTQGRCMGARWVPEPIEDRDRVDARRTAMGLNTLAERIAELSERCR